MDTNIQPQPSFSSALSALLVRRPVILQLLRFAAIGVLNTTIDFIILNFITKSLGINSGLRLGEINVIGFCAAIVQSYFWNRYWAFSGLSDVAIVKNAIRLVLVGGLGFITLIAVLFGAKISANPLYYLILLVAFLALEVVLWFAFGLHKSQAQATGSNKFLSFVVVSLIGLAINSLMISAVSHLLVSSSLAGSLNVDSIKNLSKILATLVSLVWNFIGYKLVVFKQ